MLVQNGVTLLVAIVGILSTIIGGALTILGNNNVNKQNFDEQKRSIIRDKVGCHTKFCVMIHSRIAWRAGLD